MLKTDGAGSAGPDVHRTDVPSGQEDYKAKAMVVASFIALLGAFMLPQIDALWQRSGPLHEATGVLSEVAAPESNSTRPVGRVGARSFQEPAGRHCQREVSPTDADSAAELCPSPDSVRSKASYAASVSTSTSRGTKRRDAIRDP